MSETLKVPNTEAPEQDRPLTKPSCQGYWWWMPKFLMGCGNNPGFWQITYEGPDTTKVGLFVGPLTPPSWSNEIPTRSESGGKQS
jgi:hypothetical protein